MALHLHRVEEGDSVPAHAIRGPGTNHFVVVDTDKANNAFGLGEIMEWTSENSP